MFTTAFDDAGNRNEPGGYPLERQLAIAQRRLAESATAARQAHEAFAVMTAAGAPMEAIRVARARAEAAEVLRRHFEMIVGRLSERLIAAGS